MESNEVEIVKVYIPEENEIRLKNYLLGTDRVVIGTENNSDRNRNLTLTSQKLGVQNWAKWRS
jgi:hypothetical protein